ncbi:hypothetical protein Acy02nite_58810 [Actinoplanes cyaneus]|uniref:Uncharacterized protein n=1 Tax=Actinoplanes cyaneus TaxID=52696 RepID=A0A919M376_9ACTN|nr:hypothetical protein [Actinoplanes cyaneus]MCW2141341.1 hypothetical protein [Actinoplanes cyaneus]GID68000.1 hypothetical protein Acy02nite_58810 [Actinoplanes cyaneus]
MTTLEKTYRRLLRVYPAAHREVYQEEMLGVLLAGSPPGRRLPRPADALDLLRAGLAVRFSREARADCSTAWRDAAALSALFVALLIGGFAVATVTEAIADRLHHVPTTLGGAAGLADPASRAVAWLAVAAAALAGRYRAAAVLSGVTLLVELGTLTFWVGLTPWAAMRLAWVPSMAILVAAAFATARTARPARVLAGRLGLGMLAAAVSVSLFAAWAERLPFLQVDDLSVWLPLALFAGVTIGLEPPVRRRVALVFPGMLLAPIVLLQTWDSTVLAGTTTWVPETVTAGEVALTLAPLGIVAVAAAGFARRFAAGTGGHVKVHE